MECLLNKQNKIYLYESQNKKINRIQQTNNYSRSNFSKYNKNSET